MKSRFFVIVLSLLSVPLGWSLLHYQSTRNLKRELSALAHQQTELDRRVSEKEEQLAIAQKNQAAQEGTLPTAALSSPEKKRAVVPGDFMARVNDDPRVQILMQSARRATLDATYDPLFRKLQLPPEKIEAFKDLVVRRNLDLADLRASQNSQHLSSTDPTMRQLYRQLDKDYDAAQRDLLGELGFKAWKDYEKTAPARDMISGIAGAGIVAGVPFSAEICEKLIQRVAANNPDYEKGHYVELGAIDWEIVDAEAQVILSPEQYDTFTKIEPPGPNTAGARHLTHLNKLINQAAEAEKKGNSSSAHLATGG